MPAGSVMARAWLLAACAVAVAPAAPDDQAPLPAHSESCGESCDALAFGEDAVSLVQTRGRVKKVKSLNQVKSHHGTSALMQRLDIPERVWYLCQGAAPEEPKGAETAMELERLSKMSCTREYVFEDLCCLDWANLDFPNQGMMDLRAAQNGGMRLGPNSESEPSKVVLICTEAAPAIAGEGDKAATVPTECVTTEYTMDDITGDAEGSKPGMVVLQERIRYLVSSGIDVDDVPTCKATLGECENGNDLTSVSDDFLDSLARLAKAKPQAERVWMLCKGPPPPPPSREQQGREVTVAANMACTPEYTFKDLCCANFKALKFPVQGSVALAAAQNGGLQMDKGASLLAANGTAGEVVVLCTEKAPAISMTAEQGETARVPMECFAVEFSLDQIAGGADYSPGQLVLEERIRYLVAAGMPPKQIKTCRADVKKCPNGDDPASAGQDILEELAGKE